MSARNTLWSYGECANPWFTLEWKDRLVLMCGKERAVIETDVIGTIVILIKKAATESAEILANEGTKRFERGQF